MKNLLDLFVKKQKEDLTAAEQQALDRLRTDEDDRKAWEQYRQLWQRTQDYPSGEFTPNTDARWAQMQQHMRLHRTPSAPSRRFRLRPEWRVAATILLVLFAGLAVRHLWQVGQGPMLQTVEATGQRQLIGLPDGTQVRLYPGSRLTYPEDFKAQQLREVALEGSGYFSVTAIPGSTFRVRTQHTRIDVLGTRFLVSEDEQRERVMVEVEEGKVAVYHAAETDSLILQTAHRASWHEGGVVQKEPFTLQELSTPPQIWPARGHDLSELAQELRRQSGEQIIFPAAMGHCELAGNLDLSSQYRLQQALTLLGYQVTLNDQHELVVEGDCP